MQKKIKKFLFIIILIAICASVFHLIFNKLQIKLGLGSGLSDNKGIELSPTPFPFQELTIPYLRARSYDSQIDKLRIVREQPTYDGYLTSYISDGFKINGYLTIPKGEMPIEGWPAIIFVHGYIPPTTYQTLEKYEDYVDYLARSGFVVFKIDLRGHGDSEGEPGGAYYSSDYVIDTLSAYSALQSAEFINPQRIGIWGHSMAGNVVLRSLAVKPEIPAVVIWSGAGFSYDDLLKYGLNDNSYRPPTDNSNRLRRRNELFSTYGQFSKESNFWSQVAPTSYLQDIKGAIQLIVARDDDVVSPNYSRDLNLILDKTTIQHELNEYPSGGHNISNPSFVPAMDATVRFFNKYL